MKDQYNSGGVLAKTRSHAAFAVLWVLSPVSGMLLEMTVAGTLGVSAEADQFRIGIAWLNVVQQLGNASILPYLLVPHYAQMERRGRNTANRGFLLAGLVAVALYLPLAAAGAAAPSLWLDAVAPLSQRTDALYTTVRVAMVGGLAVLVAGLGATYSSARGILWPLPAIQLTTNVGIAAALVVGQGRSPARVPLSIAIGAGMAGLAGVVLLGLVRRRDVPEGVGEGGASLLPSMSIALGVIAYAAINQVNAALILRAANFDGEGGMAKWGYAWKTMQVVSMVPTAIAVGLFPHLSRRALRASETWREFGWQRLEEFAVAGLLGAAVLWMWSDTVIQVLFVRGDFRAVEASNVAALLRVLCTCVPAVVVTPLALRIQFASHSEQRRPLWGSILYFIIAMACFSTLERRLGLEGLGAAVAVASTVYLAVVAYPLVPARRGRTHAGVRRGMLARAVGLGGAIVGIGLLLPPRGAYGTRILVTAFAIAALIPAGASFLRAISHDSGSRREVQG